MKHEPTCTCLACREDHVAITTHDGAVVGTVSIRICGEYEAACDLLCALMRQAAGRIRSSGGIIGHIKAYAEHTDRACAVSVTDGRAPSVTDTGSEQLRADMVCIVFGLEPEALRKIMSEVYGPFITFIIK